VETVTLFALILFAVTYVVMMAFQKIRPYAALISAVIYVAVGSLGLFPGYSYTPLEALGEIDWNVIMMIVGTMGTVFLFIESKMPQLMADVLVDKTPSVKWAVLALSLFSGFISAFVDNVATVLMIAPVALAMCKKLNISPVAPIICIAVSSNLQGAATLVGDTTSILLAKAANLDFLDFFVDEGRTGMFFVVELGALMSALVLLFMFRNENAPVNMHERTRVEDYFPTWLLLATLICLISVSFIPYKSGAAPGQLYKPDISNGLICVGFFVIGLLRDLNKNRNTATLRAALRELDYYTVILLMGLFIVIGGISRAGVIDFLGEAIARLNGNGSRWNLFLVYSVIVWVSVLLSAFIDNIPYTTTMLPVVAVLAADLSAAGGTAISPKLFYYGLLCGATLGGNLTPIGASANIAGIGILRREGYEVSAGTFMKFGVPFTLAAVITGYLLIWFIWA
jgi:Na+/H+ antiporter NhaD/arsenite permease-like protein